MKLACRLVVFDPLHSFGAAYLKRYAQVYGWTLARARAKPGDGATISGYLGTGDTFDRAMGTFALACAGQTQKDHSVLAKAILSGRTRALAEELQTASCARPELDSVVRRPEVV